MQPLLTSEELLKDLGTLVLDKSTSPFTPITGISIDTRTLQPGDLFIALKGDATDGHLHIQAALEKQAAGVLVENAPKDTQRCVRVPDTMEALRALGIGARKRAQKAHIVGLTGSVGKTGTKEALRHVLSVFGPTHASVSSFNNHWGVPLSLARMPRETAFGVFEMGMNHAGEITPLTHMVRPHVALITRIGAAHKSFFASPEAIADAKAEIFQGVEKGGYAILNRDDPLFDHLLRCTREAGVSHILSFGAHADADIQLLDATLSAEDSLMTVSCEGQTLRGRLAHPGRHWISNALGVLAVVHALGQDMASAFERLATLPGLSGRGRRLTTKIDQKNITILDESYNANPTSMLAALELLAQQTQARRRVAVLGDMLELGESAVADHTDLKLHLDRLGIDCVFTCGPLMQNLDEILDPAKRGEWAPDVQSLTPKVRQALQEGDLLMIKSSKGTQLIQMVQTFETEGQFLKTGS